MKKILLTLLMLGAQYAHAETFHVQRLLDIEYFAMPGALSEQIYATPCESDAGQQYQLENSSITAMLLTALREQNLRAELASQTEANLTKSGWILKSYIVEKSCGANKKSSGFWAPLMLYMQSKSNNPLKLRLLFEVIDAKTSQVKNSFFVTVDGDNTEKTNGVYLLSVERKTRTSFVDAFEKAFKEAATKLKRLS